MSVSISDAARKLLAKEAGTMKRRTEIQEELLHLAASDLRGAEKLVHNLAHARSTLFYDLRGNDGSQPVNKLSSGRVIDESFKARFFKEASEIDQHVREIYNIETAKKTAPDKILEKIFDYINLQSEDYLEGRGWKKCGNDASQSINKLSSGMAIDRHFKKPFFMEANETDWISKEIHGIENAKKIAPNKIPAKISDYQGMQSED